MGRTLQNTMINLGLQNACDEAIYQVSTPGVAGELHRGVGAPRTVIAAPRAGGDETLASPSPSTAGRLGCHGVWGGSVRPPSCACTLRGQHRRTQLGRLHNSWSSFEANAFREELGFGGFICYLQPCNEGGAQPG